MKKHLIYPICLLISLAFSLGSCIKSEYHWDNLDKGGVLDLPPIPLGSYEKIFLKKLESIVIDIPSLPTIRVEYRDTIKNIFDDTTVKKFFYSDMSRDFSIEGGFDMMVLGKDSELKLGIEFEVLDSENKIIKGVDIEPIHENSIKYGSQDISIIFPKKGGKHMKGAEHLLLKFQVKTPRSIKLTDKDYVKLNKLVIKHAGIHVDL